MRRLLDDLAIGMPSAEALKRAPGTLELLDKEFQDYAMELAAKYGEGVDFDRADPGEKVDATAWLAEHPDSYWGLRSVCQGLIKAKKWDEALSIADRLKVMLPDDGSNDGIYALLAIIYRGKEDSDAERAALIELTERSSDCRDAIERLMEIDEKRADWSSVGKWCEAMQAINPIRSDLQQVRALAYEKLENPAKAAEALTAILDLQPTDPANIHYRLAVSYQKLGKTELAKRQVLMALEESPRYRDALALLVKIATQPDSILPESTQPESTSPTNGKESP